LLGLGFAKIAQSQTTKTPFWQAVISGNEAASPEFRFWLARGSGLVQPEQSVPGGVFTFGETNTSFYSGDIEFHELMGDNAGFWSPNVSCTHSVSFFCPLD
jgi:cathepsin D